MNQILVIVHQATSNPGRVGQKLRSRSYHLDIRCPALGDALPETLAEHEAAIIFGGPMSANDEDMPFIRAELDWIPMALSAGKPYLGICLGAQLLARVLGATVEPHPQAYREIGYYPLYPTAAGQAYIPQPMSVYQWHREGFSLPAGAVLLARGETFPHQAFSYGDTAVGLQFHPEMTRDLIQEWTTRGADQLTLPGAHPRSRHLQCHDRYGASVDAWLEAFLDRWLQMTAWGQPQSA